MKTRFFFALAAASAVLSAACTSEIVNSETAPDAIPQQKIILTATTESGASASKTGVINGGTTVYWSPGDQISVFTQSGRVGNKFTSTNTDYSVTADFEGVIGSEFTEFWCIYPYSTNNMFDADAGTFTFNVPDIQVAVEGTFAPGVFPAVGHSVGSTTFEMLSVCGGAKFAVQEPGIKYVQFGEGGTDPAPLNGRVTVKLDSNGKPEVVSVSPFSSCTTVMAPDGGTFEPGKYYFFVLIPTGSYSSPGKECRMSLIKNNGTYANKVSKYPGIKRGTFGVSSAMDNNAVFASVQPVDLGLSVKWAPFNLGGAIDNGAGLYYGWGETEPKYEFSTENNKWAVNGIWNKYTSKDNKWVLDEDDDAAHALLGSYWRMPTDEEIRELISHTTKSVNTQEGGYVLRSTVEGFTTESIKVPPTTSRYSVPGSYQGSTNSWFWSSSIYYNGTKFDDYFASVFLAQSGGMTLNHEGRDAGLPVRAVWDDPTEVKSVSLTTKTLFVTPGQSKDLKWTVHAGALADKSVTWSTSDPNIAQVIGGTVTGVAPGVATITVTTVVGGHTDTCVVTVGGEETELGHTFVAVDMGLSVKWATFNIDATKPEEYGGYYSWGEIYTKSSYTSEKYKYCTGLMSSLTKYCTMADYGYNGFVDNLTTLEPEDDVAYVKLGGKWRMPTIKEMEELLDPSNCSWVWTTLNGINGLEITSQKTLNTIFLPAGGGKFASSGLSSVGSGAYYWSSSLIDTWPSQAARLSASGDGPYDIDLYQAGRNTGHSIRPVQD